MTQLMCDASGLGMAMDPWKTHDVMGLMGTVGFNDFNARALGGEYK